MPEYLFDYYDFDDTEVVDVDTSTIHSPVWEPPARGIITLDELDDIDEELERYDYTKENFDRTQGNRYHEKSSIKLRRYQEEAIQSVYGEWSKGNWSTLVVMATATGKTYVISGVANRYTKTFGLRPDGKPRRGLILAHRGYLLDQIANALAAFGIECAIEQGTRDARGGLFEEPQVVVASVQSMNLRRMKRKWKPDDFDYIITDEGHHGPAKSYQSVYRFFRPYAEHRLFLTATPKRSDDETLEDLCHSRAFVFDIKDAATYNPPCICTDIRVAYCDTKIDISNIRTTGFDLNIQDITEAITPYITPIARAIKKEVTDRTFIAYWPDVGCSKAVCSALNSLGLKVAHLDGESTDEEEVLSWFRNGLYQGLCNCAKFGEGFDLPDVSSIILGRPVSKKAEGLYKQMIGRGLRLKTGKYKDLLIVDFPWVAGKHSLLKPVDIFRGNVSDDRNEVFDEASSLVESEGGTEDLMAAITRADKVVKERKEFEVKARDGRVKYTRVEFELLGNNPQHHAQPSRENDGGVKRRLSDKQIAVLRRNGVDGIEGMSTGRASYHIGEIFRRQKDGLATYKQIKAMISMKVDKKLARSVSFDEASAIISKLGIRR